MTVTARVGLLSDKKTLCELAFFVLLIFYLLFRMCTLGGPVFADISKR